MTMCNGSKETLCTKCGHRPVCSKSAEFIIAQKAIDELSVCAGDDGGIMRVRDMDWLTVSLGCKHFTSNAMTKR